MDNSLSQYIKLYEDFGDAVRKPAPEALNGERSGALATLRTTELPRKGSEGHTETDLNAMFAPDFGININRMPFRADIAAAFKCEVPNISTLMGVCANDVFGPTDSLLRLLPEGVTVCPFSEAAVKAPGVLERYYNRIAPADNAAVALNTLLVQDGILVHIGRNVRCEKAIQLVNILGGTTREFLALRRVLVVVDQGAEARLLVCDHSHESKVANASNTVVEIDVAPGASFEYYDLEESTPGTSRYASVNARLDADARLSVNVTTLRCGTTRNDIRVSMDGEGADCRISGMAVVDGQQTADNSAAVEHNAPRCHSDQIFKYVVDGEARGSFEGIIKVAEGAHHTEAYQNNRNVLASADARMHTQPQLEIYCDDVKCSHGAATGQIDARALFYMRSRGIPEAEARTMLMQAFMADVIDGVSLAPLRDRLRYLMERRLAGAHADCRC